MSTFTFRPRVLLSLAALALLTAPTTAQHCAGGVLVNGSFQAGLVPGSMPSASVTGWTLASGTPQVVDGPGCHTPGLIQMWGNQVVGESIVQTGVPILAGRTYRVTFCAKWHFGGNTVQPPYVRFKVRASAGFTPAYGATPPGCVVVGASPNTASTNWQTFTLPDWTANQNYDTITINPENDSNVNHGDYVSWGRIDDVCIVEVPNPCARENVVANGDFSSGLVPGSMPSGSVASWSLLTASPQVVTPDGCAGPGCIQMWGNLAVGESIQQSLPSGTMQSGKTYRLSLCYRWLSNNPNLPQYVRFRVCATSSAPGAYPPAASYIAIGTTPNTNSTNWSQITFADWTAPFDVTHLTINPENDFNVNDGNYVSWGQVDDVCIREIDPCRGNIVRNEGFNEGLVPGSMPNASVNHWTAASGTPQVVDQMGCPDFGFIQMWGNQVVGESIQQNVVFKKHHTYRVSVCYRWLDNNPSLPQYVRFKLRASNGAPGYGACPGGTCSVIGTTPNTSSTNWLSLTLADWTAPANFNTLTINPENDFAVNDGNYVSWGQIDHICIMDITRCRWISIGPGHAGALGVPRLDATGCIRNGDHVTFTLSNALPGSVASFVLGLSEWSLPLFDSTLIPAPDLFFTLPVDSRGESTLAIPMPVRGLAPDVDFLFQTLVFDPSASQSFAFTPALHTTSGE